MYPHYPPELDEEQKNYLFVELKDWCCAHGLTVRPPPTYVREDQDPSRALASPAPVTLFPSLFPRTCFEQGIGIQRAYNELYAAIAQDEEWLGNIVAELVHIDEFVSNLWDVHKAVKQEGSVQDVSLGLFRSDYIVHVDPEISQAKPQIKQVEFNTIASSFGGLSTQVASLHKHLAATDAYPAEAASVLKQGALPPSSSLHSLAAGLASAHGVYGVSKASLPTCILFIVQGSERNVFDQRHLEYDLLSIHGVRSFRLPFSRVLSDTKLDDDRVLVYTPSHSPSASYEVTTVYFRAGYSPSEYSGKEAWQARLQLERSAAIKCPDILTHLAGSKKVQQVLATPHSPHLARFIPDKQTVAGIRDTFAPIYPLDRSEAGTEARQLATDPETAQRYVVKPQREGGGNNIYRRAIPEYLKKTPESHWPAHILMEMIEPPAQRNVILRNGELQEGGIICELGVYGVCIWRRGKGKDGRGEILKNVEAGYLLRTKADQSEEGGVAAGFGAMDSCCLIDL